MASDKITTAQVLFPVALLSLVVLVLLAFQTHILIDGRDTLAAAKTGQAKALEQTEKVKAQVNALAVGTLKLAQSGDKNAQNIIDQMKKAGIEVSPTPPAGMPAPQPAR